MKKQLISLLFALSGFTMGFAQFELPKLDYDYKALEPYIDSATMYIHYNNHHAAYARNLNASLEKYPKLQKKDIQYLLKNISSMPSEELQISIRNNGGGYYNHNLFWSMLAPAGTARISEKLMGVIEANFGSFHEFKSAFRKRGSFKIWFGMGLADKRQTGEFENHVHSQSRQSAYVFWRLQYKSNIGA
jgi:Fe-Mn family superoxide dismutase